MNTIRLFLLFAVVHSHFALADANDEEWEKRYDRIIMEVCQNIENECLVRYSAYELDKNELPVNNLSQVAIEGKVIVIQKHDPFWGKGGDFKSKIYTNPTWLDLAIIANEMIIVTGDHHHKYLEDFEVIKIENEIKFVELFMGS